MCGITGMVKENIQREDFYKQTLENMADSLTQHNPENGGYECFQRTLTNRCMPTLRMKVLFSLVVLWRYRGHITINMQKIGKKFQPPEPLSKIFFIRKTGFLHTWLKIPEIEELTCGIHEDSSSKFLVN